MAITLGISPGSCHIGLAVFNGHRLVDYRTKTLGGKWSNKKFSKLLHSVGEFIQQHKVTDVAVKIPDSYVHIARLDRVLGGLNALCDREHIQPRSYTLTQIKRAYAKTWEPSKDALIGMVVLKYPQLQAEYYKSQTIKTKYYERMFEAILVAHIASK